MATKIASNPAPQTATAPAPAASMPASVIDSAAAVDSATALVVSTRDAGEAAESGPPLTESTFSFPFDEDLYPVWKRSFSAEMRRALIEEDLQAGQSVSGVLIIIVSLGLLFGILAVTVALLL